MSITEKERIIYRTFLEKNNYRKCSNYAEYEIAINESDGWPNMIMDIREIAQGAGMTEKEAGGVLARLIDKMLVEFLPAKEYSLGCNCFKLWGDIDA